MDFVSKYFKESEFSCPCCNACELDKDFLKKLNIARGCAEAPFKINSGFRCASHNASLPQSSPNSSHLSGHAADISTPDPETRYKVLYGLIVASFTRIGIGKTFIHVDDDPTKTHSLIWMYK